MVHPNDVLGFWFAEAHIPKWFAKDPAFDDAIASRFRPALDEIAAQELVTTSYTTWQNHAESALALVILLDQFPRNIYRDQARAFYFDDAARDVAETALRKGFDQEIRLSQQPFYYLPFEHSEQLADQETSVRLFHRYAETVPAGLKEQALLMLDYAKRHRDIIIRFGRFPHRNIILGRPSTAEEMAFLSEPNSRF